MKEWQGNVIGATVIIIMGIGMILSSTIIEVPARYRTFLGIPYDINPEFLFAFQQVMMLLLLGLFVLGMGVGILINSYSIYKLEKKLESKEIGR